ncbi:MAG: phosphoribosylformylglycinamidine cyclo-ligase, partial [Tannerellaceae bacterium]|nr:phosphoribosylformylglycinamidine cyclo-ligase [Tannerellaceae bacterium]
AEEVIRIAQSFNIEAQVTGRVEASDSGKNELIIESEKGTFIYE